MISFRDFSGRLLRSVFPGKDRLEPFDGGLLYRLNTSTGETHNYISAVGRVFDHLGTPVAATASNGRLIWREAFTPFGESLNAPADNTDQQGFTGHIRDTATGLTYMQARYYNPVVGRFLSNDPVGFAEGGVDYFNRYSYTANDPVNMVDPDGQKFGEFGDSRDLAAEAAVVALSDTNKEDDEAARSELTSDINRSLGNNSRAARVERNGPIGPNLHGSTYSGGVKSSGIFGAIGNIFGGKRNLFSVVRTVRDSTSGAGGTSAWGDVGNINGLTVKTILKQKPINTGPLDYVTLDEFNSYVATSISSAQRISNNQGIPVALTVVNAKSGIVAIRARHFLVTPDE